MTSPLRGWARRALRRRLPILSWLPSYNRNDLRRDAIAGAIVAALAVPQFFGLCIDRWRAGARGPVRSSDRSSGIRRVRHVAAVDSRAGVDRICAICVAGRSASASQRPGGGDVYLGYRAGGWPRPCRCGPGAGGLGGGVPLEADCHRICLRSYGLGDRRRTAQPAGDPGSAW
jgi:hypothetical protein